MPDTATIGHNNPPSIVQQVQDALGAAHAALIKRRDDLLSAVTRAPKIIDSDDTAGKVSDTIKLIMACSKASEAARVAEKEPHLESSRAVDGWFKKITDPLAKAKSDMQSTLDGYLRAKADAERRQREEQAQLARQEAERAAAVMQDAGQLDQAVAAEDHAAKAEAAAHAKPADMARTRGDYGSVATLRTTWEFEITDAQQVPREYLSVNEGAIRVAIKSGARSIAGIRIYEKQSAVVR